MKEPPLDSMNLPSYQPAPLADYSPVLRDRAYALFSLVAERVGPARAKEHKGSYSVTAVSSDAAAAKIMVYEAGKGKLNGDDPGLADGVYVLVRVHRTIGRTIGVAPWHRERFAYFRLHDEQSLEETADSIAAYAGER
jgi:hypothetical protein